MSREVALFLEVGAQPEGVADRKAADTTYQVAAVALATAGYTADKILIVDPLHTNSPADKFDKIPGSTALSVYGLQGKNVQGEMERLYYSLGQGYTLCFPENGVNIGEHSAFKDLQNPEYMQRQGFPVAFKAHFEMLQKFSKWVFELGGVDKVTSENLEVAMQDGSWIPWKSKGPLNGLPQAFVDEFFRGRQAAADAKAALDDAAKARHDGAPGEKGDAGMPPKADEAAGAAIATINGLTAAIAKLTIPTAEAINKISNQANLTEVEGLINQAKALFAAANAALAAVPEAQQEVLRASIKISQDLLADQNAAVAGAQLNIEEAAKAGAPKGDEAHAHAEAEKVEIIPTILKQGFYSATADLSHNDAETALRHLVGKSRQVGDADPKTTAVYAGAFALPHVGDTDPAKTLASFKEILETYKAKVEDKSIAPPVTFQFLMNKPGEKDPSNPKKSLTGHNTVLEVTIAADESISIANVDSLLEPLADGALPEAWAGANKDHVVDVVKGAFGVVKPATTAAPYAVLAQQHKPSPLGKQSGVECIYSSTALIAGLETKDVAARKLAVIQMMAEAHASTTAVEDYAGLVAGAVKEPTIQKADLVTTTAENVEKYKTLVPPPKLNDISCPSVLDQLLKAKKAAEPKAATIKEQTDALKDYTDEAKIKLMQTSILEEAKKTVASWTMPAEYSKVDVTIAKKKEAGKEKEDDVTPDKIHLIASYTKVDAKPGDAPVSVNITLTRTVDPTKLNEVVRRCETDNSTLIDWPKQCELMAKQSMAERKDAANGAAPDTRIALSIEDTSAKTVSARGLGGNSQDRLTPKEADLVRAYFAAGYMVVHVGNAELHKERVLAPMVKETAVLAGPLQPPPKSLEPNVSLSNGTTHVPPS